MAHFPDAMKQLPLAPGDRILVRTGGPTTQAQRGAIARAVIKASSEEIRVLVIDATRMRLLREDGTPIVDFLPPYLEKTGAFLLECTRVPVASGEVLILEIRNRRGAESYQDHILQSLMRIVGEWAGKGTEIRLVTV